MKYPQSATYSAPGVLCKLTLLMVTAFSYSAHAQYAGNFGYGLYGGTQPCPYQVQLGDAASSVADEIDTVKDDIKTKSKELREKTKENRKAQAALNKSKSIIEMSLKAPAAKYAIRHMTSIKDCNYKIKGDTT